MQPREPPHRLARSFRTAATVETITIKNQTSGWMLGYHVRQQGIFSDHRFASIISSPILTRKTSDICDFCHRYERNQPLDAVP